MESWRQTRRQGCVDQGRPPVGPANKYGIRPRTQLLIPVFMREPPWLAWRQERPCTAGRHVGSQPRPELLLHKPRTERHLRREGANHLPSRVCIIGKGQLRPRICMASIFRYWDTKGARKARGLHASSNRGVDNAIPTRGGVTIRIHLHDGHRPTR